MKWTKALENEIWQVYETWLHAYLNGDVKTYDYYFDEEYHFIGSTNNEEFLSKDDTTRFFEKTADQLSGKTDLKNRKKTLEIFEELVFLTEFFDAYFLINTEWVYYGRFRFSSVLRKRESGWRFIYQHFSMPDSKANEGETLGADQVSKENLELRDAIKRRTRELEIKTRELEIEAALEKIRSKSLAMYKTDDLRHVVNVLFEQMQSLSVEMGFATVSIFIFEEGSRNLTQWIQLPGGVASLRVPYFDHPISSDLFDAKESGADYFSKVYTLEEKNTWIEKGFELTDYKNLPETFKKSLLEAPGYAISISLSRHSGICIPSFTGTLPSTEDVEIMKRVGTVFEQAYIRFLDLQKAEAQTREAQINLAVERVRARALAMFKSEEILDVVFRLKEEIIGLDIPGVAAAAILLKEKNGMFRSWDLTSLELEGEKMHIPFDILFELEKTHPDFYLRKVWSEGTAYTVVIQDADSLQITCNWLRDNQKMKEAEEAEQFIKASGLEKGYHATIPLTNGRMILDLLEPPEAEIESILKKMGAAFDLAYKRFEDLQNAEEQKRDAEIELSLERVRSQAMAMKESSELLDIVVTMRNEFTRLGHEAHYFWHMMWLPEKYEKAMTSGDGTKIGFVMELPRHIHGDIPLLAKWEKSNKPTVVYTMTVEEALDYVHKMESLGDFKNIDPQAPTEEDIRHINGLTFVMARTTHGEIGYSLPGVVENPPKEDVDILIRFAGAFDIAHRRFLDLQQSEAQAREVQIELGLEKVRSRSMGMQKSEELKEVIQVVYDEFVQLNIKIEHTGFILDYKENDDMHIWLADQNAVFPMITFPYFDCAHWNSFKEAKKNGTNFFANQLGFEEKNKFYKDLFQFIPDLPKEVKEHYFTCPALAISTVLLDNIGLYIENYEGIPYTDEENAILMRFGKVFQQTYTRFLDLQKAEEQAREAQIQLALERVRARTMAMQHSNELSETATLLFKQIVELGIQAWSSGFNIWNEKEGYFLGYNTGPDGKIGEPLPLPFTEDVFFKTIYEGKKSGEDFLVFESAGESLAQTYQYMDTLPVVGDFMRSIVASGFELPTYQVTHCGFFPQGHLMFITLESHPEAWDIFKRFTKEFQQTYTRFLDLQKAEASARESQIETALERVRSQSMGMQSSEDLSNVTTAMFEQLRILGGDLFATGIVFCDKHEGHVEQWHSLPDAGMITPFIVPVDLDYIHQYRYDQWKQGTELFSIEIPGDFIEQHFNDIFSLPSAQVVLKEFEANNTPMPATPPWEIDYGASFKHGYILVSALQPFAEANIFPRFAKVFEQTYTRFLDLQKAEAQAREAKIEMALEKIRSRTMAMQHSDELPEAANLLFKEVQALGIPAWSAGYNILADDKKSCTCIMSSEGLLQQPFTLHLTGEASFIEMHEFLKGEKQFLVQELGGKDLQQHYDYMKSFPELKGTFQHIVDNGLSLPTYQINHLVKYAHGFLLFITYEQVPHAHDIFQRFTKVFEQTYTRFLDLQKAEEQAKEARIEAALERVRARSLAMHTSEELKDVAMELRHQMGLLGQKDLEVCAIHLYDVDTEYFESWGAMRPPGFKDKIFQGTSRFPNSGIKIIDEMMQLYRSDQKDYVLINEKQKAVEWFDVMKKYAPEAHAAITRSLKETPIDQLVAYWSLSDFSGGSLVLVTYAYPDESSRNLLRRSANVFDLAYRRFLDLKKAEANARQAQIEVALERVRARALAMQQPEELKQVAEVLRQEMGLLGVEELETCSIYINDENAEKAECWYALKDLRSEEKKLVNDHFALNLNDTWVGREMLQFYHSDEKQISIVMAGANRVEWIRFCEANSAPFRGYYGEDIPDRTYHLYKFSHGAIGAAAAGDISSESWGLLKRAASAFSLAYSRFKDLTQARIDLQRLKEEKQRAEEALTNLQAAQKQLVQSEKMASLGELTAGIAHEIQNPLNFVNNFSEVSKELLDEMNDELEKGNLEDARDIIKDLIQNLEKINHHGKRADGIVKGMLQHSRSSSGTKEPTDINALADEYLRLAFHGLRAKDKTFNAIMKTDFDTSLENVNVIPQDIGRVMLNLINNAFYSVNEKQKQNIPGFEPTVEIKTCQIAGEAEGKGSVAISVTDNGLGIPEDIKDKILQPFFTTKRGTEGTGLGLSITHDIIKAHRGELRIESEVGSGASFIIQLPV